MFSIGGGKREWRERERERESSESGIKQITAIHWSDVNVCEECVYEKHLKPCICILTYSLLNHSYQFNLYKPLIAVTNGNYMCLAVA